MTVRNVHEGYNHQLQITIEKLVYGGDGLARLPADEQGRRKAVFLPFVLAEEQVEATLAEDKPGFARARLGKILQASAQRIDPGCRYFQSCGGCHYQHTSYEHQLRIKAQILKENLRRIAKVELDCELVVHPSPPWNYRNRSRFKVHTAPEFSLGYFKLNSHQLLAIEQCPISSPLINRTIAVLWEFGRAGKIPAGLQEFELFANAEDSELLIELYWASTLSAEVAQKLAESIRQIMPPVIGVVAFSNSPGSKDTEPKKIASNGIEALTYKTTQASYRVSAGAFFQVNRHLISELVELVTGQASGDTALDLYAGVGLFSSPLAKRFAQVVAVESSQTSHADLFHNVSTNVKSVLATTGEYLHRKAGKLRANLVVLDPPRGGLGEGVARSVADLKAQRVTYVSCDPATLARDLGVLLKTGYRVEQAHLLDLFPQTYHLESVFHLVR